MTRFLHIVILSVLTLSAYAQTESSSAGERLKILITIADPGAAGINLTGRPGPGYRRRGPYFASFETEKAADRIAADFQLERLDDWSIRLLEVFCLVYAVPDNDGVEELLEKLRTRPEVESAQMLNKFKLMTNRQSAGDDPYMELQHVVDTLELLAAHKWSTGSGATVAIIDTGADLTHPDLKTQISSHKTFVDERFNEISNDAHGTAVAGVIAAASGNGFGIIGVAPAARLSVLKACWYPLSERNAVCNTFTIAKALAYAITEDVDIINLSLGGPVDSLLSRLITEAQRHGTIIVGAAPGNGVIGFPANVPGVIIVDSSTSLAPFGDHKSGIIYAPGNDILVATPNGGFDYSSGSSLAAAHVTGIVALLVALNPALTGEEIIVLVADSQQADSVSVNACRAIAQLTGESGCRSGQSAYNSN